MHDINSISAVVYNTRYILLLFRCMSTREETLYIFTLWCIGGVCARVFLLYNKLPQTAVILIVLWHYLPHNITRFTVKSSSDAYKTLVSKPLSKEIDYAPYKRWCVGPLRSAS